MSVDTTRLEAFSDGVFAIAITLLVLEIKVPPLGTALGAELLHLWPSYLAYKAIWLFPLKLGAIHCPPLSWREVDTSNKPFNSDRCILY